MKLKSILFPADFSKSSEAALEYASTLARESGAKLFILHVGDVSTAYLAGYGDFAQVPDLAKQIEAENRALLKQVRPTVAGIDYESRYVTGTAVREIVDFADRENVDLIVMGTHGRTGVSRLLTGSVAEGVLRRAKCPVLTVKQPSADEDADSPDSDAAADDIEPKHPVQPRFHTKLSLH